VKLRKLDFVDVKRFKKGVDMDVKAQLLTVALKKGQKANPIQVNQAVHKAGYVAVESYTLKEGKLEPHPFPKLK